MHGADCYESGEGLTKNRRKNDLREMSTCM